MRRLLLAGLVTTATLAVGSVSAWALIVRVHGRPLSYEPVTRSTEPSVQPFALRPAKAGKPLEYHRGPVMTSNTDYTFYWDPTGGAAYPSGYESGLDRYFEDLAHDSGGVQNTDSLLTQYKDSAGEFASYDSHFGG